MNEHDELIRRLREQRIPNWIHSTGETPRQNGMKQCPLCEEAATVLESAKRVPLTDEQHKRMCELYFSSFSSRMCEFLIEYGQRVERAHRIDAEGQEG